MTSHTPTYTEPVHCSCGWSPTPGRSARVALNGHLGRERRKAADDRVAVARSHDYEPDPDFTATSAGRPDCRVCGQPERYHR